MRICAADCPHDVSDDELARVLDAMRPAQPTRTLLFRGLAQAALRQDSHVRQAADDRFIEHAAAYLLDDDAKEAPQRNARPLDDFMQNVVCVAAASTELATQLQVTDRAIEMEGKTILMALPRLRLVDDEIPDNARVWLGGGDREEPGDGFPLKLAVGDTLDDDGGFLIIDIDPRGVVVRFMSLKHKEQLRGVFPYRAKNKVSVQG